MDDIVNFFIKFLADYLVFVIVIVGGIAMLALPKKDRYQKISRGVVAGLVALLLAKIASIFYQGDRPYVVLGEAPKAAYLNNPGFPSDHVLFVFTIALVVWLSTKNRKLGLTLLLLCALVAVGRVLALVHTPIDVLGGIACAFLAIVVTYGWHFTSSALKQP